MAPVNGQTSEVGTISRFGDSSTHQPSPTSQLVLVFPACLVQKSERKYESDCSICRVLHPCYDQYFPEHGKLSSFGASIHRCFLSSFLGGIEAPSLQAHRASGVLAAHAALQLSVGCHLKKAVQLLLQLALLALRF